MSDWAESKEVARSLRKELRRTKDCVALEEKRILGLEATVRDSRARLQACDEARQEVAETLRRCAADKPLSAAHRERQIALLAASVRDKQKEIDAIASQPETTAIFEAYMAADEFKQERRRRHQQHALS